MALAWIVGQLVEICSPSERIGMGFRRLKEYLRPSSASYRNCILECHKPYRTDHFQSHLNAIISMVPLEFWDTADAFVAVSQ